MVGAHSLIDVITSDPTMPNVCPRGAIQTGAAVEVAAFSKERAWTAQAEAQGETFYPLAIEACGTLNARFHVFLQLLAVAYFPSPAERAAFMAFALQRIRAVSLKGVCAIILGRPTSPGAPGGLHTRGSLPLAQPKPRPLGKAFVVTAVSRAKIRGAPAAVSNVRSSNVTLKPAEGAGGCALK